MIHIYTGCGKGKTTAALGLALRASGAGLRVFIGQFNKCIECSEHEALKKIKTITIEQFGSRRFIKRPTASDTKCARRGLERIKRVIASKKFNMVILDEINVAVNLGLLMPEEIISLLDKTPCQTEIILTGRDAHPALVERADLVSLIEERKHYFKKGIVARKGIEY